MSVTSFSAHAQNKTIKTIGATTSGEVATLGDKTEKTAFDKAEPVRYIENHGSKGLGFGLMTKYGFNGQWSVGPRVIYRFSEKVFTGVEAEINLTPNSVLKTGSGGNVILGIEFPSCNSPICKNWNIWFSFAGTAGFSTQWEGLEKSVDETQWKLFHAVAGPMIGAEFALHISPIKGLDLHIDLGYKHQFKNQQFEGKIPGLIANLPSADKQQVMSGCHGNTLLVGLGLTWFFHFGKP